ncbi:MAG: glycosyltransferase [Vicinamibacterales bacterium]
MKVIALLPVRNEAWVLRHSLACLSAFADVVMVSDQDSDDNSRDICREFPKVVLLESREALICEQARWTLWDAARDYEGSNLLWCTDADELVSPKLVRDFLERDRDALTPGTVIDCHYYHTWNSPTRYRDEGWPYAPYWKPVAVVDDRRMDYTRARALPLHEERVPVDAHSRRLRAANVPVLHLQWLLPNRNQMRQAWYRCREWLQQERTVAEINGQYAVALPARRVRTRPIPPAWVADVTFPDVSVDREASWQERDVLRWFDERGPAFFEPLEIWHVAVLREAFRRAVGREPRSDRAHHPGWSERAGRVARRLASAARRRIGAGVR